MIRTPANACPKCGKVIDAATAAFGEHEPQEGDISICFYCCAVNAFKSDLTLVTVDLETLPTVTKLEILAVIAAIGDHQREHEADTSRKGTADQGS